MRIDRTLFPAMKRSLAPYIVFLSLLVFAAGLGAADAKEAPPAVAGGAGNLIQVTGGGQAVQPGVTFGLTVRLINAPVVEGVEVGLVRTLSGGPAIECDPALTDAAGFAQVLCVAGYWPLETQVLITIGDEAGRVAPDFGVTIVPLQIPDGLNKLQGDRITVPRSTDFELAVTAAVGGVPQEELRLTVSREPGLAPVSCPSVVFTDSLGQARITCRTLDSIPTNLTVLITFRDGSGRSVTFTVFVLAQDLLSDGITKVSGDDQAVLQGAQLALPLVARVVNAGRAAVGVRLEVSVSDSQLLTCPQEVFSGSQGLAYIHCTAGMIQNNGFAAVHVNDGRGTALQEPFRVSVIGSAVGQATNVALLQPRPNRTLRGKAGETLEDAIVIRARDEADNPVFGAPFFFSTSQNLTFRPAVAFSGPTGEARASVELGCPGGRGEIRVGPQPGAAAFRIPIEVVSSGPALLTKQQGDDQTGRPGQRLDQVALVALLTDSCFQPVQGRRVDWSVEPADAASLENVVSTTDRNGRSSVIVRLGSRPGPFEVTARHGDLEQTFTLSVVPRVAGLTAANDGRIQTPRGALSAPLTVAVASEEGLPIPGLQVAFEVIAGEGEVVDDVTTTNAAGEASTRFQAPDEFGTTRVRASLVSPPAALTAALGSEGAAQGSLEAIFEITIGGRFPVVEEDAFVNGASFRTGWTPGGFGTIFGQGLMEDIVGVAAPSGPPFPTAFRGVRVLVNGAPAPLIALADTGDGRQQINLQVPFETAPGTATVVIENNGVSSTFENIQIRQAQPGIFEVSAQGRQVAAALHPDFRLVAPSDPARPGETILLYLTGLGATTPPVPTNAPGPVPPARPVLEPVVGLDHAGVVSLGAFYAPGFAALYQINFVVPEDTETGLHIVTVTAGDGASQSAMLPVRR